MKMRKNKKLKKSERRKLSPEWKREISIVLLMRKIPCGMSFSTSAAAKVVGVSGSTCRAMVYRMAANRKGRSAVRETWARTLSSK
jgi:hypothetical protein